MHEQAAQMLAPALRCAHKKRAVTTGELPWNETHPGSQVPSVLELRTIADCGDDCRCGLRANALDFGNALTRFAVEKDPFDFLVEDCDSSIEVSKEDRRAH